MASYDEGLAERIRAYLAGTDGLHERKMFGGIGWTAHGNMIAGAHNDGRLMIRCAKEASVGFAEEPGAQLMARGKTKMRGWVLVDTDAVAEDAALARWLDRGLAYVAGLPPKK